MDKEEESHLEKEENRDVIRYFYSESRGGVRREGWKRGEGRE